MADTERKTYISTILQQKSPLESIELIKLRLNESREINSNLIEFFQEYLKTQESYAAKLNHVLLKGSKLFIDETKFNSELETLGLFEPIWNSFIGEINTELKLVDSTTKTLNLDVLSKLNGFEKKYKGNSENLNNLRKLGFRLQNLASNPNRSSSKQQEFEALSKEWETRVPTFVEIVENYDFNRFIMLKDVFLSLQSSNQDTLPELSKQSEKSLEFVLNFDPNDEIKRFANEVAAKNIQFDQSDLISAKSPEKPQKADKHHSFLPNNHSNKNRQASSASMATTATDNSLMNDGFTGSPTKSKDKNKLKSRVGSIFGKKKKDKKSSRLPNTISESPVVSSNTSRSDLTLSSENVAAINQSTPAAPVPAPAPSSSQTLDRRSSAVSSEIYQTSRSGTLPQSAGVPPKVDNNGPRLLSASSQPLTPSPVKNLPQINGSSFNNTSEYYTAGSSQTPQEQHIPPPVPVARGSNIGTSHGNDVVNGSLSQQVKRTSIHHGDIPPPPPRQRRDIQSGLFVGLDVSKDPANGLSSQPPIYESREHTPGPSVSPNGVLNRQLTGTSIQRQGTGVLPSASFNHPDLVYPGLNCSVAEVVNATYKDNQLVKGNVVSELALSYIVGADVPKLPSTIKLAIPQAPQLGKLLVNNQFLRQLGDSEFEIIDVPAIHLKTVGALKYSIPIKSSIVSVLPVWRFEPHQASVVISVKLTPEILAILPPDSTFVLSNFIVSVSISGANATSAATRPTGSFNKDKARVTWVYTGPVTLGHNKEERIIARFATDGLAKESEHGVQIKFTVNNEDGAIAVTTPIELHSKNVYKIDPFDNNGEVTSNKDDFEDDWKIVPTVKTLIAGRYEGHS